MLEDMCILSAIGTDREEQLSSAFEAIFPHSVKLLCLVHKHGNIKMKLREFGISDKQSKEILNTIFGYQEGNTFYTGLVDATDVHDFKVKLQALKTNFVRNFMNDL